MKNLLSKKQLFLYSFIFLLLYSSILLIPVLPLNAEHLFLKDGSILKGKIIGETANDVIFQDDQNKVIRYPHNKVMRVIYIDLKMGKYFFQKRNGETILAYLVDEDQENYILRKEFYKPEEFTLKRSDVLFMTEKNPAGLKVEGQIGTNTVSLSWFPPYDVVKKYNIYIKKDKSKKYELIDTTKNKSITLKNLSSRTTYYLIVTSIDSDNYESLPSNEITITTPKRPPFPPSELKVTQKKTGETDIKWKPSVDPDGTIVKYKIYKIIKNKKKESAGETKNTSFKIIGTEEIDSVLVSAVDDMGAESDTAKLFLSLGRNTFLLSLSPGVIFPVGKFGEMYNIGFGGMLSFSRRDLFFNNFEGGISLGFYYMQGKDLISTLDIKYQDFMFVPLYIFAGYNIAIGKTFFIKPVISFGGAYLDAKYFDRNKTVAEGRDQHLQVVEFAFKAGVAAEYRFNYVTISAGCEYGAIIERTGLLSFILVNFGAGYSF